MPLEIREKSDFFYTEKLGDLNTSGFFSNIFCVFVDLYSCAYLSLVFTDLLFCVMYWYHMHLVVFMVIIIIFMIIIIAVIILSVFIIIFIFP